MAQLHQHNRYGQALVEVLLALGLSAILLPALLTGLVASRQGKAQQQQRTPATALLSEAVEATRSVRENGWTSFAINGTYHPAIFGSTWTLVPGAETISGFTRSVVVSDFYRDGSPDPSTKKVDVAVSWNTPLSTTVNTTLYLTRYLANLTYNQTTAADFNTGTLVNTKVTSTAGGEVTLSTGLFGKGDWCQPNLSLSTLDLPKSGVANALTAIEGQAFAGTGDNASGVSFANVKIDGTPTATILGTYDGYKTNDIFGETTYAYLATDNNFKEIEIINLSTNPYSEAGWFDAPGNGNGNSVYVNGSVGYMTDSNKLYTFDLSSHTGSRGQPTGSITLSGTGNKMVVANGLAYIAISGNSARELEIVNVSNPASPSIVGWADVSGINGQDVYVDDIKNRAYLVTSSSSTQPEFFIIDTSTKTGSRPILGSYDTNGMNPKGVTEVIYDKAIIVGSGAEEYQVVKVAAADESNPTRCGGLNIDTGVNGVASVLEQDKDAYSYIITGDVASEFKIIAGGPSPGDVPSQFGTYESAIFDPGYSTAFNRLDVTYTKPANTNITFQIAIADPVSGSCTNANYVFVDPDSTGAIPFNDDGVGYENPARCFKYRAVLSTTDLSSTPIFSDITVNYSP